MTPASLSTPFSGFGAFSGSLGRILGSSFNSLFGIRREKEPGGIGNGWPFNSLFGIPVIVEGMLKHGSAFNSLFGILGSIKLLHYYITGTFNSLFGIPG